MVINIGLPASFRRALSYNERKVDRGRAVCINAGNFILDVPDLTLADKVHRFDRLDRLRPDYPERVVHATIAFHPSDELDKAKEVRVATEYIRELSFDAQPWLLYRHTDTRAPHLHLVLSKVTPEGEILSTYRDYNETVAILRKIERDNDLVPSRRRERNPGVSLSLAKPSSPEYGQVHTRDGITAVLAHVLPTYNYSNLTELNALLRQYRVWADNGKPGGFISETRSFSYQMLDDTGSPLGRRIPASAIGFNPGLDYLENRFRENALRAPELSPLALRVQLANYRAPGDLGQFAADLRSGGVDAVPFVNKQGRVYDMVFIDHSRKLVASAHRLTDVGVLRHLEVARPPGLEHQRELLRDMRMAKELLLPPADQHILTQHLRKVKQHRI